MAQLFQISPFTASQWFGATAGAKTVYNPFPYGTFTALGQLPISPISSTKNFDVMQILGQAPTQWLLYDNADSELFYIYDFTPPPPPGLFRLDESLLGGPDVLG